MFETWLHNPLPPHFLPLPLAPPSLRFEPRLYIDPFTIAFIYGLQIASLLFTRAFIHLSLIFYSLLIPSFIPFFLCYTLVAYFIFLLALSQSILNRVSIAYHRSPLIADWKPFLPIVQRTLQFGFGCRIRSLCDDGFLFGSPLYIFFSFV